ncbi:MAG: hypothetical protein COT81_01625 [Candidatus Buchananbacteria bacterium CG10_big_fil_rev_8_21_14_0_10_42_9]|uniref:Serine aminopeptidase S33 domain-containing protein n=1 Tax=Candidatus Buchananbacteria bacterium CG10_big_fil_rev_8_21_14_0_10_42_9 TaxID=1974526 RepID=A0A2H0W1T4_9BACT|nr:MAG: hypothetical protein COT81_01625 [Candidatus Buchananbacteria bacterium CG10_big_fil_rev_8_21_14_0_10_42_9]
MQKVFIKNRKNQNLAVIIEEHSSPKGLAFVMHGLGSFKEQAQIETVAKAFRDADCTVVRFDTTNTLGESDGDFALATTTNYYEDLEDVLKWSTEQDWYQEPFILAGHSLGAICSGIFTQKFPKKVKALALLSAVVSGKLSAEASASEVKEWEAKGWQLRESRSKPGTPMIKLPWSHMVDRMRYDLLPQAKKLTMPVILIVGDEDETTPVKHHKILYKALPGKKKLEVIIGGSHGLRGPALPELYEICLQWIANLPP